MISTEYNKREEEGFFKIYKLILLVVFCSYFMIFVIKKRKKRTRNAYCKSSKVLTFSMEYNKKYFSEYNKSLFNGQNKEINLFFLSIEND